MAFALVGFQARGIDVAGPSYKRGIQQVVLAITGTASDVDLDIGDDTPGTFWTAALADATYGDLAEKALDVLTKIAANSVCLLAVKSPELLDKVQSAAAGSAGEYAIAIDDLGPNIALHTGEGETSYTIVLEYELNDYIFPMIASFG